MKEIELRLLAELLGSSRKSDRELAKAIGASQPTATRIRHKLEKEGYIREYTIIPDFSKLGYAICAFTFAKFKEPKDLGEMKKALESSSERLNEIPQAVLIERGLGPKADGVVVSFHETYSGYVEFEKWIRQFSLIGTFELNSFIINLQDKVHYRYLTFKTLAKHLLTLKSETKKADNE